MRKQIRRIVTDSTPPAQPKDPDTCTLVALLRAFADSGTVAARRGALSHRRDWLRRGQGAARGRHRCAPRADAQPLSATAHRPGRARRPACQGGAARLPTRRPDARPDRGRHRPVAQQERGPDRAALSRWTRSGGLAKLLLDCSFARRAAATVSRAASASLPAWRMTSPRKHRATRRSPEGLALSGYCLGASGTAKTAVCRHFVCLFDKTEWS
jgi:hypothetical protein